MRSRRDPLRVLVDADRAPERYAADVRRAAVRALRVGAKRPLRYVGMGMTAIVLCDARGRAFKVGRRPDSAANRAMLHDEAEWLRVASAMPEVRRHVARFYRFHAAENVIERECVRGGSHREDRNNARYDLHRAIEKAMLRHGWSAPEYKDDSYVYASGRGWVLVDASMAHLVGTRLAARAARTLKGESFEGDSPSDLAFALRAEAGRTLPERTAHSLSDKLLALRDLSRRSRRRTFR